MKIPSRFKLMGCEWTVRIIPAAEWQDAETVGLCSFERGEITIKQRDRADLMEQVLMHEYIHAVLEAMHSKLYDDEDFVDIVAGLLHQVLVTAE